MKIEFKPSTGPTLGVELELQLVDLDTLDHVPVASAIVDRLGRPPHIKNELFESTIEINTGICKTVGDARADLTAALAELHAICDEEGWGIVSSGTHPFNEYQHQTISPDPRYHSLMDRLQYPLRRLVIFGIHFHVGVAGAEPAIAIMNSLTTYLPHFLALSASSPYWRGKDTGLASVRAKLFEVLPTGGIPWRMANWGEFVRFMDALLSAGAISTVREVWTDVRPHPDFGTVELRICDATPTLTEVSALAALAQSVVVWLSRRYAVGAPLPLVSPWIVKENKWRAVRYGLEADLITTDAGALKPLRASIHDLVEEVRPIAAELGCAAELADLDLVINAGTSTLRQRRVFAATGSHRAVVESLITELRTDRFS
jgi:carboxylate-amine ligase